MYSESPGAIATLYEKVGRRGGESCVLLRVRGEAGDIIDFLGRMMYLPNSSAPHAVLNLNILAPTKGIAIVKDENRAVHGISIIIIASGVELTFLQMLNDLANAPNRLHGVAVGKRDVVNFRPQTENSSRDKYREAAKYTSGLNIPRLLVKTETRLAQTREKVSRDTSFDALKGMETSRWKKDIHRTWGKSPEEERKESGKRIPISYW